MQKRQFIPTVRVGSAPQLSLRDIRDMAKANPQLFAERVQAVAESGKMTLAGMRDMRGLYAALADVKVPIRVEEMGMGYRTVMASAFPVLTGTLIIKSINDSYAGVPTIGQELVTEMDDPKKITQIAAIHSLDKNVESVKEGEDFPEISGTEEKMEIRHKRNGRMLTISAESIEENEIADIVTRVNALGEIAADWVEEQTLYRVFDFYGSAAGPAEPYVYRPGGSGVALYSATANTPGKRAPVGNWIQNNAFVDESDLENARVRLATMRNARDKRISIPQSRVKIVAPTAIVGKVLKVLNSQYVPGVENEMSNWGPSGKFHIASEQVVSSPKIDDISTSAWLYGDLQKQFMRKWKLRFEYVTLGQDTESYLRRRIAFQARIAWDVEIGATDYVYVLINTAAAAMPKDA